MLFQPVNVPLKVFSILFKIHSACCEVYVRLVDFEFPTSSNQSDTRVWLKLQNLTQAINLKPVFWTKNSKSTGRTCTQKLLSREELSLLVLCILVFVPQSG